MSKRPKSVLDAERVIHAASVRKPGGSRWGCFIKEVDDTHVGFFSWFQTQEELVKFIDVWCRCFRTGEAPPSDWTPPFRVVEGTVRTGTLLTRKLQAISNEAETVRWAGPVSDIARSTSRFWRGLRESFLDWGMEDDQPQRVPRLSRTGLLPPSLVPRFTAWVAEYIEC